MSNPMLNPQPNYSGVTIQITNPTVNAVPPQHGYPIGHGAYATCPQICCCPPQYYGDYGQTQVTKNEINNGNNVDNSNRYPASYPAEYYINDYGRYNGDTSGQNIRNEKITDSENSLNKENITNSNRNTQESSDVSSTYRNSDVNNNSASNRNSSSYENNSSDNRTSANNKSAVNDSYFEQENSSTGKKSSTNENYTVNNRYTNVTENSDYSNIQRNNSNRNNSAAEQYDNIYSNDNGASAVLRHYDDGKAKIDGDLTKSTSIIGDIDERDAKIKEEKKNAKESKIIALTDEYIKSLENYLNNPNDEIRLMASKEILTRLDEDKDRYNDAALNALLNKMLQDPSKLVRIAALSAFGSQLASGNDYTVQLLHNIQANPSADKEDVLQAADILLKMSAGTEVKYIPNPQVKENKK